jgi:hypothetical protein
MDPTSSRPEAAIDVLARMMTRAVTSVFTAYRMPLHELPRTKSPQTMTALAVQAGLEAPTVGARVAFFGAKLHGEFMIASTFDVIAQTRPSLGNSTLTQSAASQILIRDWTGELANQILGHFKNQSRRIALTFEARTPIPLSGPAVTMLTPKAPGAQMILLRAGRGGLAFCFDAFCHSDLDLRMAAASEEANDGSLILL